MDTPASRKKDTDTIELSVYLPSRAVKILGIVAERRFIKRAALIRQIIMREIQDNPEYETDTDTVRSSDTDNSDTILGDN